MPAKGLFRLLLTTIVLCVSLGITGCAARVGVGYRVYDPYRSDYHVWDNRESDYYNQWIIETHRSHQDFGKLHRNDQQEYWKWRHDRH